MNQEEAGSFEKNLGSDPALSQEYEDILVAFNLIKHELQKRDEEGFRKKLLEIMEEPVAGAQKTKGRKRPKWYFLLPLAASLAILLAIFLMNRGSERILSRFFHPEKDPVVLAHNQVTRSGETETGILLYQRGNFEVCMNKMSALIEGDPENRLAKLYYLLASMELDLQEEALHRTGNFTDSADDQLGQALIWYHALALLKSERSEDASRLLQQLTEHPGPYQTDARRLQKILSK